MYEYRDKAGEWVTLRSTLTLQRLIRGGEIVGATPFRLSQEDQFVPAALHPTTSGVAAEVGVALEAPAPTAATRSLPTVETEARNKTPVKMQAAQPEPNATLRRSAHDQITVAVQPNSNPWTIQAPASPNVSPVCSLIPSATSAPLVARDRLVAAVPPARPRAALHAVAAWHAGALFAGLAAYSVCTLVGLGALAGLASAAAIVLVAHQGGTRMTSAGLLPSASSMWMAGGGAVLASTLIAGAIGFFAAALSVGALIRGCRRASRAAEA